MSDMRLETLADSVLDAWESGAQVDFSSAGDDAALRLELADLERAATVVAAAAAARTASIEPMRPEFLAKLALLGTSITFPAPAAALPSSAAPVLGRAIARRRVAPFLVGAAAGFALAWMSLTVNADGEPGEQRDAFLRRGNYAQIDWKPGASRAHGTVKGDVVWCTQRQQGYLRIDGLEPLPPGMQYQLWIVDADRTGAPVDGGLFNLASASENVVPIQAKLPVRQAKAFVVTVEKQGGVVVSEQHDVVAIAGL